MAGARLALWRRQDGPAFFRRAVAVRLGETVVNKKRYALFERALLVERGETHEVRNTGTTALKTVNVYVPPAYTPDGEELSRGKK